MEVVGACARLAQRELGPFSFVVEPGELVCLLGTNGSGKTTAISLGIGLIRPSLGEARVLGRRVGPFAPPPKVGYMPDRAEFWNWQTATNNLLPFAHQPAMISTVLDRVGLRNAENMPVRRFSRGMRQRLSLARALLAESYLLVMDEPTIALDVEGVELLVELVAERRSDGTATVLATHDQAFLEQLDGARVVRIENGRSV